MITETINKIQSVPFIFRMPDYSLYPSDNNPDMENWLFMNTKPDEIVSDRLYLPIFWTSYYKNNCNYGNDTNGIFILQEWLNMLDVVKKYYTIVQFDNGILNDISHLDIKVFSMAGGRKDYGLPLICQPHNIKFESDRDIFCSFVGRITNPIRQEIVNIYSGKKGYYISTDNHELPSYCGVLSRSVFGLCPAGYSVNSFRIQECLEQGCIPVWVSKEWLPVHNLNFQEFGVLISDTNVDSIDEILKTISKEEIEYKQSLLKEVFNSYFTFESNKRLILENL